MKKLAFVVDDVNDPELLNWIYSLGRSRSLVINNLLRQCMANGGIPITGAASPICRPTNTIREEPVPKNVQLQDKQLETKEKIKEAKAEEPATNTSVDMEQQAKTSIETPIQPQAIQQGNDNYVSSAPKIYDEGLVMNMMSAFGGV